MSWRCLRFRAAFTPGERVRAAVREHRQACPACAAWAALLEGAATAPREPLPEALRGRLRAIPRADARRARGPENADSVLPLRLRTAPAPLPEPLRQRLRAIARQAPARPPLWIVQARYAVAASTLLVTLAGAAFGNPLDHGRRWTRQVGDQMEQAQDLVRNRSRERLATFRDLVEPWREAAAGWLARTGEALAATPRRAGALLHHIPGRFDLPTPDVRGDLETRPDGAMEPVRETTPGDTHEP